VPTSPSLRDLLIGLPPSIKRIKSRFLDSNVVQRILNPAPHNSSATEDDLLKLWDKIVGAFCGCDLAREEDKLVAVPGLAKFIRDQYPDLKYVAGMWQKGLPESLLWFVWELRQVNGKASRCARFYRAPLWSWPSVDGKLFMNSRQGETFINLCRVVDFQVVPVAEDTTGQLKGGVLTIAGNLMTVSAAVNGDPRALIQGVNVHINNV
jgi:hypothetical protein